MNFNYKKYKNKNGLRLSILLAVGFALGACAYDPVPDVGSNSSEPQADNSKNGDPGTRNAAKSPALHDLVVSGRLVVTSYPESIGRLTILEGGVLATDGQELALDVQEIVSWNGVIDTTPQNPALTIGSSGRSGKLFHLTAKSGSGQLKIISAGQNGATGQQGSTGDAGGTGGRGSDGADNFSTECWLASFSPFGHEPGGTGHCSKNWYCSKQTGDGAQGARGGTGRVGLSGGPGGDASPVLVELADPTGIQISTEVRIGKGGDGGLGGNGGPGGGGGDPGSRDSKNLCRVAERGPQGPVGDQGPQGPTGKDGVPKPVCLRLGVAQIGDCGDFDELTQRGVQ